MIPRPSYIAQLDRWRDRDLIKVVSGIRRCGKSTLLQMYADHLIESGVSSDCIISINLEQLEYEHLLDYRALHQEIMDRCDPAKKNYVFIDEVQNVPDFQRAIDSLYTRPFLDIYITGSNALLLKGTLATLLSGRYIEIPVFPLSFSEYYSFRLPTSDQSAQRLFSQYISTGGMPGALVTASSQIDWFDYLDGILNTILFKDVAQRLNIANTIGLGALVSFLFDNIGNLTSAKAISDFVSAQGTRISPNTVADYLSGLVNSYIFYSAKRYDIKGKRLLKLQEKYYAADLGMRRMMLAGQLRDEGRILENVVFLELKRRFRSVCIGRLGSKEIDFVAEGPEGPLYFQVAETVKSEKTLQRELAPLQEIPDNYPKFLLTLDDVDNVSRDGVQQINAIDWLLLTDKG